MAHIKHIVLCCAAAYCVTGCSGNLSSEGPALQASSVASGPDYASDNGALPASDGNSPASNGVTATASATHLPPLNPNSVTSTAQDTWVLSPAYGASYSRTSLGIPVNMAGLTANPNTVVEIAVLDPSDQDPNAAQSTWTPLARVSSASAAQMVQGAALYPWSAVLAGSVINANQWSPGGVVHLQVRANHQAAGVFDTNLPACSQLYTAWADVASNCTVSRPWLTLVDATTSTPPALPYLTNPYTDANTRTPAETERYYQVIDPQGQRINLPSFMAINGFYDAHTHATFFNAGDLGFGRDMHCRPSPDNSGGAACYVGNYDGPGGVADVALPDTIALNGTIATVAMEYRPNDALNPVAFYVYDGRGVRIDQAILDSQGPKAIPQSCLTCHGGSYSATTHSVSGTNFLAFDTQSLAFSTQAGYTLADQQEALRLLNQLVRSTHPAQGIANFINDAYSPLDVQTPGATQASSFIPSGWIGQEQLYTNVVKPYCRSCHDSQAGSLAFQSAQDFTGFAGAIGRSVCGSGAHMPASEVTDKRMRQSGARAYLVDGLGIASGCGSGVTP